MSDNYKTPLISTAISMAVRNQRIQHGAIFHSDRGANYTSTEFGEVLRGHGIRQSVGRTGVCYDNALAESFFAALKNERVNRTQYPTRKRAMEDVARYIELRYNSRRLHSGLGYRTPNDSPQRVPERAACGVILTTKRLSGISGADHPRLRPAETRTHERQQPVQLSPPTRDVNISHAWSTQQ